MNSNVNTKLKKNINWKQEVPHRVYNALINSFGKDFDLNNKEIRDKVIASSWIKRTPNFGEKSWQYLINYIKYRWPQDDYGTPPKDFKIMSRHAGRAGKEKRNLQIWIDREAGMTYAEIGRKNNISLDRARQIYLYTNRNKEELLPYYEQFK